MHFITYAQRVVVLGGVGGGETIENKIHDTVIILKSNAECVK